MDRKSKYLLFALPSFILIFTVMLFPVGYAIIYSFTDFRLGKSAKFIGLENYISIFQDSEFLSALGFTLILTLVAVLSQFVIGMILALLLDNIHHFKKPISIMIYIPYFITAAAMGVIFRWMFMSNWGIIDQICRMIGISTPGWLDSPFWSRVVIILGEVFQNTPFSVIILYAGLQSMPLDQIEAAKIDGAGELYIYFKIVLPLSLPILATIGLMVGLGYWNDWTNGLYYISDTKLYSLQQFLKSIIDNINTLATMATSADAAAAVAKMPGTSIRMAMAVIGVIPIMVLYPFFQKAFIAGISLGGVKE